MSSLAQPTCPNRLFRETSRRPWYAFDNDEAAWEHYNRMYQAVRDSASDEILLSEDRITSAEIEVSDTPVLSQATATVVIEAPMTAESQLSPQGQIERIEKVAAVFAPRLSAVTPPMRRGRQTITPEFRREISRIQLVKSAEQADNRYLSINRANRSAILSGEPFPLEAEDALVGTDAAILLDYFRNYEGAFEGDVAALQRDYFTLMSWLYFSPFLCDLRLAGPAAGQRCHTLSMLCNRLRQVQLWQDQPGRHPDDLHVRLCQYRGQAQLYNRSTPWPAAQLQTFPRHL